MKEEIILFKIISSFFDAMPCLGTTLADVDTGLIKREFLPKAVAEDVLAEDKRTLEVLQM